MLRSEYFDVGESEHLRHAYGYALCGVVDGGVGGVDVDAVSNCCHCSSLGWVSSANAFERFEEEGVVGYDEVAIVVDGFAYDVFGGVDAEYDSGACVVGVAYLQTAVVPLLLYGEWGNAFYGVNDVFYDHCSGLSTFMLSSWSCVSSMRDGASIIVSRPELFLGNAMTSRIESSPARIDTNRSNPNASPP